MDIDLIFKIAAIGIIVSILNQVLSRSGREEQATMTTLAGLVVVLLMTFHEAKVLFQTASLMKRACLSLVKDSVSSPYITWPSLSVKLLASLMSVVPLAVYSVPLFCTER